MKQIIGTFLAVILVSLNLAAEPSTAEATLTKVGQEAPGFAVTALSGKTIALKDLKDKVVLINFFATWCGPCLSEMPHLENEVWQRFKDKGLVVVAIGREHPNTELSDFQKKHQFTFEIAGDPKRDVYGKYATAYIPRNILVGKDGKIIFQSVGFEAAEFQELIKAIEKAL